MPLTCQQQPQSNQQMWSKGACSRCCYLLSWYSHQRSQLAGSMCLNSGCFAFQVMYRVYGKEIFKAGVFKLMWTVFVIMGGMPCQCMPCQCGQRDLWHT
jgi:hypothetical protein